MLDLSPAKLLVIVIVAVILLGPDKLPQVARQVGATVRKLRAFQQRVDEEVRQNIPDLPSSQDIARFARSPITLLNQWADDLVEDPGATAEAAADDADWPADPAAAVVPPPGPAVPADPTGQAAGAGPASGAPGTADAGPPTPPPARSPAVPDDPSMN
ncbi:MAG TPA: twin-arginine translocase TatA/TatE family subunit [Acidimicrobiales bacterium]|nr:twin-arginine translocase TatA/TatE family subunit [Acidimicrobiales bacterium]